ncbi:Helicase associated domain protein [Nonomuraea sp. NPDC046802]|uniref:DEAD/DEAH box helicase n=1 Tax=Nonomuraea sp. NPDC046802 TaxID=3154919 RepID=UPI0033CF899C
MPDTPVLLWPHQADAVDAACGHLAAGGRSNIVMACGTGKTIVGAETSRRLAPAGRVLVVVPTIALADQTATGYARHLADQAGRIIAVCSDKHAARTAAELRHDLEQIGGLSTTDPAELLARLTQPDRTTVITTYQSLPVIAATMRAGAAPWDLIVIDEAHRSAGRADRAWSLIHDDRAIPAQRRLYMTATPRLMNSDQFDTFSMDDTAVYGQEVYRLPFVEAIEKRLLADYRLVVAVVTDAEIAELTASNSVVQLNGHPMPASMLAAQVALLKAAHTHDLHRVITYHHRVAKAQQFAVTLHAAAALLSPAEQLDRPVFGDHVNGGHSAEHRRQVLRKLELAGNRLVVISNARVLAEGVDVPELDGVMFADPRDSTTDVVQAVGRALRRGTSGSKIATIVVPILINEAESPEAALEGSQFDVVYRVVRALRAHDERLADELDENRIRLTREDPHQPGNVHELPEWLQVVGHAVTPEFARALLVRTVHLTTSTWLDSYALAAAYRREHGHVDIPADHVTEDGRALGTWLVQQRQRYRRNALSARQVRLLEELGITWNILDARWEEGIAHARAYRAEHGHLHMPTQYECPDGYQLGPWLTAVRNRKREGKLQPERVAELEQLGIVWHVFEGRWQYHLDALDAWIAEQGTEVPQTATTSDGVRVGNWLSNQRQKAKNGTLSEAQKTALEQRGVLLNALAARWQANFEQLAAHLKEHGGNSVPKNHPLEEWVNRQRDQYRRGELPQERMDLLRNAGFSFDPYADEYVAFLAAARSFAAREGHLTVPTEHRENGLRLAAWINNRRTEYRRGVLAPERVTELEATGIVWDPHVQDWRDGLADCQDFHAEHGHLDIPPKTSGRRIKALTAWLERRRREYHCGELPEDRIKALEATGMQWTSPRERGRLAAEKALRKFHAEHGHIRVPATYVTEDGVNLGTWLGNKRSTHRKGGQTHPDTLALLTELGANWLED